jgi:hypothetical protein
MYETKVINYFGGPGISKSTSALKTTADLKERRISSELVTEYAKDKVWRKDFFALECQPFITGKQLYKQWVLNGQVKYIVTDCPLLLGIVYQGFGCTPEWEQSVVQQFKMFDNINILLKRNNEIHPYDPEGRVQTYEEALEKDQQVKELLLKYDVPFIEVEVQRESAHIKRVTQLLIN